MIYNILKRYPNMTIDDIKLEGMGDDIRIVEWNSEEEIPSMEMVWEWIKEDGNGTIIEEVKENSELENVENDLSTIAETVGEVIDDTAIMADTISNLLERVSSLEAELNEIKGG